MNHCRSIVFGIFPDQRIFYNGLAQISFRIPLSDAFIDCVFQRYAFDMDILSDIQEYNRHSCILADWNLIGIRNLHIFLKLSQNLLSKNTGLFFSGFLKP